MLIGVLRQHGMERTVIAVLGVKRADYIAGAGLRVVAIRRSSRYRCMRRSESKRASADLENVAMRHHVGDCKSLQQAGRG